MDFSRLTDIPVIDGHIHFRHPERADSIFAVMDTVPFARVHLLSTIKRESTNDNPAVIHFKAHHPDAAYISGALDYSQLPSDPARASENLANQIVMLKEVGFDGLKMVEGTPRNRKWLQIPSDAPEYEGMWAALEELGLPLLYHVADPEEFWDRTQLPAWAQTSGRDYEDPAYPLKEELYAEMDRVLERHPNLKLLLAHFYFLSADLERAGEFLDAHPNVDFDLTPGLEMINNFSRNRDGAREFFVQYQDRLIYGTDITSGDLKAGDQYGMTGSLGKAWVVRCLLETDDAFVPPEELGHWLYAPLEGFRGLDLPREALVKIYRTNFERTYGPAPLPLDRDRAIVELERMAAAFDAQASEEPGEDPARQVAAELKGTDQ